MELALYIPYIFGRMPFRRALLVILVLVPAKEYPNLGKLELRLLFFASLISPPSEKPFNQKISCECQDEKIALVLVRLDHVACEFYRITGII